MSDLGPISLGAPGTPHSQVLLDRIEESARFLVEQELGRACRIVESRRDQIGALVTRLIDEDTLDAEAIRECFG